MGKVKIVTHAFKFHTDDVFAVAALKLLHKDDDIKVVRVLRNDDHSISETGDYVLDIGDKYDPEKGFFDHHQEGGAGKRDNGIPYASFGLIWKHFGEKIAGSKEAADRVDEILVQPIDAYDNGFEVTTGKPTVKNVHPYMIQSMIMAFRLAWKEEGNYDAIFLEFVEIAEKIIEREIVHARAFVELQELGEKRYEEADDKRIVTFHKGDGVYRNIGYDAIELFDDVVFFLVYRPNKDMWQVIGAPPERFSLDVKKRFPKEWAGKRGQEFADITGINDAIFCHNARFMCVAKSKEGALKLAQLALEA